MAGGVRRGKPSARRGAAGAPNKRWSNDVTRNSDALDLDPGVFKLQDPEAIAQSLKRSALRSTRRKSPPLRSAMSMLNFYMNRAGRNLPEDRRAILEQAKQKLREAFGRER